MTTRVLIPVDGSLVTDRLASHVIKHFQGVALDAVEIHLLNVQRPVSGGISMFVSHSNIEQYHQDKGLDAMAGVRDILNKAGIPFTVHIGIGDPAAIIIRYARENQCDQIIMGTRGHGEVMGLLLGSVTSEVVAGSDIPVTLIK